MTKKHYILYAIALMICTFGIILFLFSAVFWSIFGLLGETIFTIACVFPFPMAAILSFCFTKKAVLTMGKDAVIPIFFWNAGVCVFSIISFKMYWGNIISDISIMLFFLLILYIIPCILCSAAAILIYSKTTDLHGRVENLSRIKRSLIIQFSLFFIPAVLLVLYYHTGAKIVFFQRSMAILSPYILTTLFASCTYAVGVSKTTAKSFPIVEFVFNIILSAISSLALYFYITLSHNPNDILWIEKICVILAIIMAVLPPVAFGITSLITLFIKKQLKHTPTQAH